jgi:hypothetical protein
MSRASLSITSVLLSTLLAACGGGGGGGDSSQGTSSATDMQITASVSEPSTTSNSCKGNFTSTDPVTMSLEELPYCDPAPLEEMMAMDDPSYQNQLSNHWPDVESLLHRYIPPHVTVYPAPRNFIGAMDSCLQQHGLLACREYMNQLIGLNKGKQQ